ncbi:hypothetical protein KOM00_12310 [Geomonas sp. Red69]|uniref:hypothetical protein n=1 Tax=Geomonas diazotrophica TaxID=2843197 RepID=UPI001C11E9A5|nr:hypothetical protein [Geomonas diazotrophica]MBU5637511.1 hypothetical protein [Geomonas diazotrophica]
MGRPSTVISRILAALADFSADGNRLPATNDGKVNVTALCRELRNVRQDDVQHFHKKEEIKQAINTIAQRQGLLPVGHRSITDDADNELELRIRHANVQARKDAQSAVEAASARDAVLEELRTLRTEMVRKDLEIQSLRERLRLIEEAGLFLRG